MATEGKQAPQVTIVTMKDGRIVEFAGKRQLLKESIEVGDGTLQVRLDFVNGDTRLFTLPPGLVAKFALHGAEQKLGDEIAGLKAEGGKEADIDDKVLAIDELIDRLYNGEWSVKREGGIAGTSVLIQALVEMYAGAKSIDEIKAFLKPKSQAEKMALRQNPRIKPFVEKIEAAKAQAAAKKFDTDAMLNELG